MSLTVGLVGCGAIGSTVALQIQRRFRGQASLVGIWDRNRKRAHHLLRRLKPPVSVLPPNRLIRRSQLLIEAASPSAVAQLLPEVIAQRRSMLILSTGGLLLHPTLAKRALRSPCPIYLPSGALAGLDGIRAASVHGVKSITLTTRKPPSTWQGAPAVVDRRMRLTRLKKPRLLFQGTPYQAAKGFPQNVNVAATLAFASSRLKKVRVRVVADPTIRQNIHELEASGSFGKLRVLLENRPDPANPKTSRLAAYSAVATLKQILSPLKVAG